MKNPVHEIAQTDFHFLFQTLSEEMNMDVLNLRN